MTIDFSFIMAAAATQLHHAQNLQKHATDALSKAIKEEQTDISKEAFWEIVKFNHPTHQIVYCTEKALKTLEFEGSETL